MAKCGACSGKGSVKCPKCRGTGRTSGTILSSSSQCKNCSGSGVVRCGSCNGKGTV